MCLGVPMTIIEGDEFTALAERGAEQRRVSMLLVGAQPPGTQILVHIDSAVRVLDAQEAQDISRALDGLAAALNGENFEDALDSLKPERIVGLGGLTSRDEAMRAGETEVDYLMFGGLEPNGASAEEVFEQAGWWAEVFNLPCVAVAHAPEDAPRLARCGAEFLGLGPKFFDAPQKLAELVAQAQAEIDALEPEA